MSDILFDEQSVPPTGPSAGQGLLWCDNILSLPMFCDDTPRRWGRSHRTTIINQTGFATETYVTNSGLLIPSPGLQAQTMFEWIFSISKTAAGVATPIYRIKIGPTQTTADTVVLALTGPAQTAAADIGYLSILATIRSVGASGVTQGIACWNKNGAAVGFANNDAGAVEGTNGGFDNSVGKVAGQFVGISINGGASAAWTITQVRAVAIW